MVMHYYLKLDCFNAKKVVAKYLYLVKPVVKYLVEHDVDVN